jgi:hypothetical protein
MPAFLKNLSWALALALFVALATANAQTPDAAPAAAPSDPNAPVRLEGTDPGSGIHWVRIAVNATSPAAAPAQAGHFILECRETRGKREVDWYVSFGFIPVQSFDPPFKATKDNPFPPSNPIVKLKMSFEGYMKTKPFTRAWEGLPSGEYRYCNSSMGCSNLDQARFYMSYVNALPTLRISFAKKSDGDAPEQVFNLDGLVHEANKTPICAP